MAFLNGFKRLEFTLVKDAANLKQKRHFGKRPQWKLPYLDVEFLVKVRKAKQNKQTWRNFTKKVHLTYDRKMTIVPEFVGLKMAIHNGLMFVHVLITPEMINHKMGEFSHTRKLKYYLEGMETSTK
ncbi:mitochondrial ribosomal small subunit component [Bonamia ostreae]|uniref:Mitochondrial ribosomal small subunit component n=1 Tax=Bonamia ostreae TaxID=126728 RepID=A0ABV2AFI7_9EUKA